MCESDECSIFLRPVLNVPKTGKRIGTLMKEHNIPAKKLNDLMGFSAIQSIYNWTRGKNAPSLDNIIVLSKILGVPINDIVVTDTVEVSLDDKIV